MNDKYMIMYEKVRNVKTLNEDIFNFFDIKFQELNVNDFEQEKQWVELQNSVEELYLLQVETLKKLAVMEKWKTDK